MNTKLQRRTRSTESDTLVTVARTIGSALGTIAAKIHRLPKSAPRKRRSVSVRKPRMKRRR
jgi:hypothetical protein